MLSRILLAAVVLLQTVSSDSTFAQVRSIQGTYRNLALGYSIQIPRGLRGITGDQAGPERGVKISLPSGATITVFGEPNTLEYKTPEEGVNEELTLKGCRFDQRDVKPSPVGKLKGAKGHLICGNRALVLLLAFWPLGGPIYWFRLDTTQPHESEDQAVLQTVAAGFKLIPWK